MQKDRKQRFHDAADIRIEIEETLAAPEGTEVAVCNPAAKSWHERLAWPVGAGVLGLIALASTIGFVLRAPKPQQPMRLSAEIGADANLTTTFGASVILSRDGTSTGSGCYRV